MFTKLADDIQAFLDGTFTPPEVGAECGPWKVDKYGLLHMPSDSYWHGSTDILLDYLPPDERKFLQDFSRARQVNYYQGR